jgi:hypothetical protein
VILLDADVIQIDHKFVNDTRYAINRVAIDRLKVDGHALAMVAHTVLEVVGVLSYGTPAANIPLIPTALQKAYGIIIIPDPVYASDYAQCSFNDLLDQMSEKMSLPDAVQAVQIRMFAPHADALLTWNAKHFKGKIAIPVLTPEEWFQQQPPLTAPTP